ncbi:type II toxin-antitoxin system Phd/YefM family antitoxin [Halorubrum gandharaense]
MCPNVEDDDVVTLSVTVPERLLEELDDRTEVLGYTNRSAFVRAVLRDLTDPTLTSGAQEGVSEGYADAAAGRTMSMDEARKRLGIDEN